MSLQRTLARCTDMLGRPLSPEYRARLEAVVLDPSEIAWDQAHGIILNGRNTLWQAWLAVDSEAPRTGPVSDLASNRLSGWPKLPSTFTLYRALRWALGD